MFCYVFGQMRKGTLKNASEKWSEFKTVFLSVYPVTKNWLAIINENLLFGS